MQDLELDMEMTPDRANYIKNKLLELYAKTLGVSLKDLDITIIQPTDETA